MAQRRLRPKCAPGLFLGSTIGNFERTEAAHFPARRRQRMSAGDSLLLGADLVKAHARLIAAYDDPLGVTAAFNLNLLARINRELGGNSTCATSHIRRATTPAHRESKCTCGRASPEGAHRCAGSGVSSAPARPSGPSRPTSSAPKDRRAGRTGPAGLRTQWVDKMGFRRNPVHAMALAMPASSSATPLSGSAAALSCEDLNLTVEPGETLVLLGRSGSGKTTALRLINGMILPTSGEVLVEGKATTQWDLVRLRRCIGYVIQESGLFPHFTVERNVGLVPALERWPEA